MAVVILDSRFILSDSVLFFLQEKWISDMLYKPEAEILLRTNAPDSFPSCYDVQVQYTQICKLMFMSVVTYLIQWSSTNEMINTTF